QPGQVLAVRGVDPAIDHGLREIHQGHARRLSLCPGDQYLDRGKRHLAGKRLWRRGRLRFKTCSAAPQQPVQTFDIPAARIREPEIDDSQRGWYTEIARSRLTELDQPRHQFPWR